MSQANEILNFWFGNSTDAAVGKPRKIWFSNEAEFDNEIKTPSLTGKLYRQHNML